MANNPMSAEQARHYIAYFAKHVVPGTTWVGYADKRKVEFANMTDEEAIQVARGLIDIEAEAANKRNKKDN